MARFDWRELGQFSLLLALIIAFVFLIPDYLGFAAQGFDQADVLSKRNFYRANAVFLFGLFLFKLYNMFAFSRERKQKYGNSVAFTDQGEKPHLPFFKRFTILQLGWISAIIFTGLGFVNQFFVRQSITFTGSFSGAGFITEQQFSPTEGLIFDILTVPGAENGVFAFFIALIMTLVGILAWKQEWNPGTQLLTLIGVSLVGGALFGVGLHNLVYSGQQLNLTVVAFFWAIMGLITVLTGSWVPAWTMHLANNLFASLQNFFTSGTSQLIGVVMFIALVVGYVIVYRNKLLGDTERIKRRTQFK